jgi:Na+/melibiose symporter-like transporter
MIASRNTFTYVANVFVLLTALLIFVLINDKILQFRILAIIIVLLGTVTTGFYVITIKEPYLVNEAEKLHKDFKNHK